MKVRDSFHPYAAVTIIFWSLAYVFTRIALGYFSPFSLGLLRYAVASVALAGVAVVAKMRLPKLRDIPLFLISGASGFFLYMITFNTGSRTVTAATSSVIIATTPIITALLARLFYKEKLTATQYAAIGISFLGVAVLSILSGGLSVNTGLVYLFAAAVLLSTYNLVQRKLTKTYSALQATAFSVFFGTAMLGVFAEDAVTETASASVGMVLCVLFLGVFSSALAYVCWAKALSKAANTSFVSNYMFITPFLTSLLGFVISKEKVDISTVIGGIIIIAGLAVFNLHYVDFKGKK